MNGLELNAFVIENNFLMPLLSAIFWVPIIVILIIGVKKRYHKPVWISTETVDDIKYDVYQTNDIYNLYAKFKHINKYTNGMSLSQSEMAYFRSQFGPELTETKTAVVCLEIINNELFYNIQWTGETFEKKNKIKLGYYFWPAKYTQILIVVPNDQNDRGY